MKFSIRFICFNIFLGAFLISPTENRRNAKVTRLECLSFDKKMVNITLCEIKAIRRDVSIVNIRTNYREFPLTSTLLEIQLKNRGNSRSPYIYNFTTNCCDFMENKHKYPLASLFYKLLGFGIYSNMNHTCPYNHNIYVENFRIDDSMLSLAPMPFGDYGITLNFRDLNTRKTAIQFDVGFKYFEDYSVPRN